MFSKIDNLSDNILVAKIRQNDKDAFKSIYDRYSRKIYFFSLKYISDSAEVEDLVQTVFINVWQNRKSLDPDNSVKSYIYKAAVNYIYNYLKRKKIQNKFIESQILKGEIHSNLTYEQVFFNDLERSINIVVETLPSRQQRIFHLNRTEGLTEQEIAKKLGLSVRTVENQIYRALKKVKAILKSKYFRD
jgi:RNA polymerase sigma-70 factor (family 1)